MGRGKPGRVSRPTLAAQCISIDRFCNLCMEHWMSSAVIGLIRISELHSQIAPSERQTGAIIRVSIDKITAVICSTTWRIIIQVNISPLSSILTLYLRAMFILISARFVGGLGFNEKWGSAQEVGVEPRYPSTSVIPENVNDDIHVRRSGEWKSPWLEIPLSVFISPLLCLHSNYRPFDLSSGLILNSSIDWVVFSSQYCHPSPPTLVRTSNDPLGTLSDTHNASKCLSTSGWPKSCPVFNECTLVQLNLTWYFSIAIQLLKQFAVRPSAIIKITHPGNPRRQTGNALAGRHAEIRGLIELFSKLFRQNTSRGGATIIISRGDDRDRTWSATFNFCCRNFTSFDYAILYWLSRVL